MSDAHTVRPAGTWSLGNLALFLCAVEALTGLVLIFHYRPWIGLAHADLMDLREASAWGFVQELHHWGAQALVVVVWLHLLRTVLRGTFRSPRQLNWSVGVALLVLTLAMAATGSLLPWDENALGAAISAEPSVSGRAAPAPPPGAARLLRDYAFHTVVLPLILAALVAVHWRLARRDSEPIGEGSQERTASAEQGSVDDRSGRPEDDEV